MRYTLSLFLSLILLFSCAPKVERECTYDKQAIDTYRDRRIPQDFRIYGLLKYGPVKLPMMLAKFEDYYTVRVAKAKGITLEGDRLCLESKCYILPAPPENLVFGKLLTGKEYSFCREGLLYFRERGKLYERLVVFRNNKPLELAIIHLKSNESVKVLFGPEDNKGYFKELRFILNQKEIELTIEEVEI
ncbi:hypothetical protein BCF55_0052 [Hydrogenivirga caldilitoris]|uniref:Lipoprotein n=1 Tax=Hydrogenivirga caldilitoris TaxID=246264 RepID=A0A497XLP7_9AQUI|nr:hypothetical protein [Hydrogenivirga caldilitoris]RLJ69796.1 hypothetical protein BCF55_0052 [Hydrogenivirga caldilitoris]